MWTGRTFDNTESGYGLVSTRQNGGNLGEITVPDSRQTGKTLDLFAVFPRDDIFFIEHLARDSNSR